MEITEQKYMRVKLRNNLFLVSDRYCYKIVKLFKHKRKEIVTIEDDVIGYYDNIEAALNGLKDYTVKTSYIRTFEDLKAVLEQIREEIAEFRKEIES